jgi:class 3 adenylate cyclase
LSQQELEAASEEDRTFGDDNVRQMLLLAERLREQHGGELDDAAIQAVSEACYVPVEYVRIAVSRLPETRRKGLLNEVRTTFRTMDSEVRLSVVSGILAAAFSLMMAIADRTGDQYGLFLMLGLIVLAGGIWNVSLAKDTRTAAFSGAIFGGLAFATHAIFSLLFQVDRQIPGGVLIPITLAGALGGVLAQRIVGKFRNRLGIKDPQEERQELLRQLHELQSKLRSGEQSTTFLSLDIVGSTKMKELADPLSVEFTFTEYHKFVEEISRKYGGSVHSTAGDGVTCAFEHPTQAFAAARNVQAGIIELNTFRNKIGQPIVLRAGIHMGTVVVPPGHDIRNVNFAHVIDIAAHLQKVCPPGGIAVSDAAGAYLPGGPSAVGAAAVESQEVKARVWLPRVPQPQIAISAPPSS